MRVISNIASLRDVRRSWQADSKVIAFVPTMGNLHQGHLNLVKEAKLKADIVVVSIFVNPLQFGPDEDLEAYPRTLENDRNVLSEMGVDVLFTPQVKDIYSRGLEQQTFVEVPGISYMICGASRPGHFRGVATVVSKLFNMVHPHDAFFGEKDFQQLQVIRTMVRDLSMGVNIHGIPTERDVSGLALSSRNGYLTDEQRHTAATIYSEMKSLKARIEAGERNYVALAADLADILTDSGFNNDYVHIVNAESLKPAKQTDKHLVILVAAFLGNTRLIDNLQIKL